MSPEQALGERLDERSDIFSLGTAFFHVFGGRLPFQKTTPQAVLQQISQEEAPRLWDVAPLLPRPIGAIVNRMMARRAEDRYQDVGVILEDLTSYERRGLLRCADSSVIVPGLAPVEIAPEAETLIYEPPAEGTEDVVI
jgi:serine/threonine protein kinase